MYEGEPYFSRRLKLLSKIIKYNKIGFFPELIGMDLEWRTDWWNISVNQKNLDSDMALAKRMISDAEYEKLVVLTHLVTKDKPQNEMLELLNKTNLWNSGSELPESDIFMYHLVFYLSKQQLITPEELLARFELELRDRVFNETTHSKNLDILAYIYSETDKVKLKEIDLLGWKKYKLPNYALNLLLSETDEKKFDSLLNKIAMDFPYEPQIAQLKFANNKDKNLESDLMAKMVIGEYKNVQNLLNSYQLKDYMFSLAKQINHQVYKDSIKSKGAEVD